MARPYASRNCTQRPGCHCGSARCRWLQQERQRQAVLEAARQEEARQEEARRQAAAQAMLQLARS